MGGWAVDNRYYITLHCYYIFPSLVYYRNAMFIAQVCFWSFRNCGISSPLKHPLSIFFISKIVAQFPTAFMAKFFSWCQYFWLPDAVLLPPRCSTFDSQDQYFIFNQSEGFIQSIVLLSQKYCSPQSEVLLPRVKSIVKDLLKIWARNSVGN